MIVFTSRPYTLGQIKQLRELFEVYIKTVIDIKKKLCVAGMDRHFEGEQILLQRGSAQKDIWGGGIDLETMEIDYNSFINIRPNHNNLKNEIQSEKTKQIYRTLTGYFFQSLYDKN